MHKLKVGDIIQHRNGGMFSIDRTPDEFKIKVAATWWPAYLYKSLSDGMFYGRRVDDVESSSKFRLIQTTV